MIACSQCGKRPTTREARICWHCSNLESDRSRVPCKLVRRAQWGWMLLHSNKLHPLPTVHPRATADHALSLARATELGRAYGVQR